MPFVLVSVIVMRAVRQSKNTDEDQHLMFGNYAHGGFLILFLVSLIVWTLFHGYFMSVIVRDYRFLREQDEFDYYYYREVNENGELNEKEDKTQEMV